MPKRKGMHSSLKLVTSYTQHLAPWPEPVWLMWLQIWDVLKPSMGGSPTLSASETSAQQGWVSGEKGQPAAMEVSVLLRSKPLPLRSIGGRCFYSCLWVLISHLGPLFPHPRYLLSLRDHTKVSWQCHVSTPSSHT